MRPYGVLHFNDLVPIEADTVQTFLMVAATAQASDWLSSGSTAVANAGAAGAGVVRITAWSTPGTSSVNCMVNLGCTNASSQTSGTSIASSGVNHPVMPGQNTFQVPGGSTGFSLFASTACFITIEMWRK